MPGLIASAQIENTLVLSGGTYEGDWESSFTPITTNWLYSPQKDVLKTIEEMELARAAHNVVGFSIQAIYYIGGAIFSKNGFKTFTGKCEMRVPGKPNE